jgi:serpin B
VPPEKRAAVLADTGTPLPVRADSKSEVNTPASPPKPDIDALIAAAESAMAEEAAALTRAEDHNAFALALHAALGGPRVNLFYSPLSVRVALAMTYAGARGETALEMHAALRASAPGERFHADLAAMIRQFQPSAAHELAIANSLWSAAGAPVLPAFAEVITRHYGAALNAVDFRRDPDGACRTINQSVRAATNQRIPDLLDPSLLTIDTRLVLVNAVYFKGAWQHPFELEDTHDAPFYLENGGSVKARMMSQVAHVGYRKGPGYQAVTLPYFGADLSLLVVLPDRRDGLPDLERSLTVPMIGALMRLRPGTEVELFLPRFTITWGGDVVRALGALGIQRAFTREEADFSGINGRQPPDEDALYVSHVLHKAFSAVNEEGTEAAVATAVEFSLCAGIDPQPPPPVFRADHPFLFAIGDRTSGTVLFLGHVVDPTQKA